MNFIRLVLRRLGDDEFDQWTLEPVGQTPLNFDVVAHPGAVAVGRWLQLNGLQHARAVHNLLAGSVIERPPIHDGFDNSVLAMRAVVTRAGAGAPARAGLRAPNAVAHPAGALLRVVEPVPHDGWRRGEIIRENQIGVFRRYKYPPRFGDSGVAVVQVQTVRLHVAQVLVGFSLCVRPLGTNAHMPQALLGEKRVGMPARRFGNVVLQQPVRQVHIRAEQFGDARHLLQAVIAVMGQKLEIEARDGAAGLALAGRAAVDGRLAVAKGNVGAFQQIEQSLAARNFAFRRVGEDRIALQFGEGEQTPELAHDDFEQVAQYFVGMVQFHPGQIRREAGDVGEDEVAVLGFGLHLFNSIWTERGLTNRQRGSLIGQADLLRHLRLTLASQMMV